MLALKINTKYIFALGYR